VELDPVDATELAETLGFLRDGPTAGRHASRPPGGAGARAGRRPGQPGSGFAFMPHFDPAAWRAAMDRAARCLV
jgi:hypothetical protein